MKTTTDGQTRSSRSLQRSAERSVGEELIKEFQKAIMDADKLYEESEKQSAEDLIDKRKPGVISLNQETMTRDSPREVQGN